MRRFHNVYRHNSVQTSAAEAVKTTFTMAGYPAGHQATLTSTGSCHLLGGSEDSSIHWGEFQEEVVVSAIHSVQIRCETVAWCVMPLPAYTNFD